MHPYKIFSALTVSAFLVFSACDFDRIDDAGETCIESVDFTPDIVGDSVFFTSDVQFSGSATALSYTWTFGGGVVNTSTEPNPRVKFSGTGDHTVSLVVSTAFCSPKSVSKTVNIGVPKPAAGFSPASTKIIVGNSVVFNNTTTGLVSTNTWYVDGIQQGNTAGFTFFATDPDTVTIALVACNSGGCDTFTGTVVVRPVTFSRSYDLDDAATIAEKIVGLAQLSNGGLGTVMSNNAACFIVRADNAGNVTDNSGAIFLGSNYLLEPARFTKVGSDYFLTGSSKQSGNDYDIFLFKINAAFGYVSLKNLQEPLVGVDNPENGYCTTVAADNINLLVAGNILNAQNQGIYLPTVTNVASFPVPDRHYLFSPDNQVEARYILRNAAGNGYLLGGTLKNPGGGLYEAAFFRMSDAFAVGARVFLGAGWTVQKLLLLGNGQDCLVIGNDNNGGGARAALVKGDNTFQVWTFPGKKFYDGVLSADNRIALAGSVDNGSSQLAALFFLQAQTGALQTVSYPKLPGSTDETAIVMTAMTDGGFTLGGYLNTAAVQKSLLIKTDRNGVVDP